MRREEPPAQSGRDLAGRAHGEHQGQREQQVHEARRHQRVPCAPPRPVGLDDGPLPQQRAPRAQPLPPSADQPGGLAAAGRDGEGAERLADRGAQPAQRAGAPFDQAGARLRVLTDALIVGLAVALPDLAQLPVHPPQVAAVLREAAPPQHALQLLPLQLKHARAARRAHRGRRRDVLEQKGGGAQRGAPLRRRHHQHLRLDKLSLSHRVRPGRVVDQRRSGALGAARRGGGALRLGAGGRRARGEDLELAVHDDEHGGGAHVALEQEQLARRHDHLAHLQGEAR